ncbi:MAG: hypothetical protein J0L52_04200 [Caulobacterales bacterium]|nr:hypothetical protein [Caulobacterales bacterium]
MDHRERLQRDEGDEVAALLRGLRLGVIALIAAVVTAGLVIGIGRGRPDTGNPYYGDLVRTAVD